MLSLVIHHNWLAELGRLNCSQYASRALLVAVAITSVAELTRKEAANLKLDIDVIIAK